MKVILMKINRNQNRNLKAGKKKSEDSAILLVAILPAGLRC